MSPGRQRANGEGSIFPYCTGYAAYVWVTTPDGARRRKWAYGKTREDVHGKWLKLHAAAQRGPVATNSPTLANYLAYWLREVVVPPNYAPLTCATYETLTRLYVVPGLGAKRLDKLTLRDVRAWLNQLRNTCQCCAQGKDARRPENRRRCCALPAPVCCRQIASERTIRDAWTILCSSLTNAVTEELIPKNVAALLHVPNPLLAAVRGRCCTFLLYAEAPNGFQEHPWFTRHHRCYLAFQHLGVGSSSKIIPRISRARPVGCCCSVTVAVSLVCSVRVVCIPRRVCLLFWPAGRHGCCRGCCPG
jgi:hypothetical protein